MIIAPSLPEPEIREIEAGENYRLTLTPWTVQNIIYETVQDHMLKNSPQKSGYTFSRTYDLDPNKSQIKLEIGHDWGSDTPGQRPACFVFRDAVQYAHPTIGQLTDKVVAEESEETRLHFRGMNCSIACIGKTVGFVEQFADWIKTPFVTFGLEIKRAFKFRQFKIAGITPPQPYKEAVNNFIIVIQFQTSFDESEVVSRDDLKIKTISRQIFDGMLPRVPLKLQ
jgi:hypothetical protein